MSEVSWRKEWGRSEYDPRWKEEKFLPELFALDEDHKLGQVLLDVGAGKVAISDKLKPRKDRITVKIDTAGASNQKERELLVAADIEALSQPTRYKDLKQLAQISEFLKQKGIETETRNPVSTAILSEILNYVDYRKVLTAVSSVIRPGGRIIIWNMPNRGYSDLFSEAGVKDNYSLLQFMQDLSYDQELIKIDAWTGYETILDIDTVKSEQYSGKMMLYIGQKGMEVHE